MCAAARSRVAYDRLLSTVSGRGSGNLCVPCQISYVQMWTCACVCVCVMAGVWSLKQLFFIFATVNFSKRIYGATNIRERVNQDLILTSVEIEASLLQGGLCRPLGISQNNFGRITGRDLFEILPSYGIRNCCPMLFSHLGNQLSVFKYRTHPPPGSSAHTCLHAGDVPFPLVKISLSRLMYLQTKSACF